MDRSGLWPALAVYHAVVLLVVLLSCGSYFWMGLDSLFAVLRIQMLAAAWQADGLLAGNWLPDAMYGYGYPLFYFYPPLGYYVGAAAMLLFHLGPGAATRLSFMLSWWLSGLLAFGLAWMLGRRHGWRHPSRWALAASLIYILTPFHLSEVFSIASLSECWSWPTVAALFASIEYSRERPWAGMLLVAATSALALLGHVVLGTYAGLFAGLYVVWTARDWRWPLGVLAGGLWGLGLCAIYWLPAWALLPHVLAHQPGADGSNAVSLQLHVLPWLQFLMETPGDTGHGERYNLGLNPGLVIVAGFALGLAVWLRKGVAGQPRRRLGACLALTAIVWFMMSPGMSWDLMPARLLYIQYPWRLLVIGSVLGILALLYASPAIERWIAPEVLTVAAMLLALPGVKPLLIRSSPVEVNDRTLGQYLRTTWPLATEALGTTYMEFLPTGVSRKFYTPDYPAAHPAPPDRLQTPEASFRVTDYYHQGSVYGYRYDSATPAKALIHVFYFPGWRLSIDEQPASERLQPDETLGLVSLDLPGGRHTARLNYDAPPIQHAARRLSLACVIAWGAAWLWIAARSRRRSQSAVSPSERQ